MRPELPSPCSECGDSQEVKVHLSTHFQSYTGGSGEVEATGGTVLAVLKDLDRQFPGLHFRIADEQDRLRPHINVFVGTEMDRDLGRKLSKGDEIHILAALSGG